MKGENPLQKIFPRRIAGRGIIPEQNVVSLQLQDGDYASRLSGKVLLEFCEALPLPISRSTQILGFLVKTVVARPRLSLFVVLCVLAALAGTMTYTGFLVIGVLADYLGTGRVVAGILLGAALARFPRISNGKLRVVGLLPKPVRRPLIVSLLLLCCLHFLSRGEYVEAAFTGLTTAFVLALPWLRRAVFDRVSSSVFSFAGRKPSPSTDDMVIDGEFREKKD